VSRPIQFKFRLYVVAGTPNSAQALANLNTICRVYLPDRHEIKIVDVFQEPKRALADGIFMTPTLVKLSPAPVKQILGTLSETETVLQALELERVTV
jgi:circadian clock protein KaiB